MLAINVGLVLGVVVGVRAGVWNICDPDPSPWEWTGTMKSHSGAGFSGYESDKDCIANLKIPRDGCLKLETDFLKLEDGYDVFVIRSDTADAAYQRWEGSTDATGIFRRCHPATYIKVLLQSLFSVCAFSCRI